MQKTNNYKTMKSFFFIFFSNFKLRHKISWLAASWLPWQPRQKPGFMVLCELFLCTTLPILKFVEIFCYRVWPIRGLAWLPWQPDWNDNHFKNVRVMGFMVVYNPCGLTFRKVLKFDVENWAVDHWTPLKWYFINVFKVLVVIIWICILNLLTLFSFSFLFFSFFRL